MSEQRLVCSFLYKIAKIISDEVDKELYSFSSIKKQLLQLEQALNQGKITEEEYNEKEEELLDRLEENMEEQCKRKT